MFKQVFVGTVKLKTVHIKGNALLAKFGSSMGLRVVIAFLLFHFLVTGTLKKG